MTSFRLIIRQSNVTKICNKNRNKTTIPASLVFKQINKQMKTATTKRGFRAVARVQEVKWEDQNSALQHPWNSGRVWVCQLAVIPASGGRNRRSPEQASWLSYLNQRFWSPDERPWLKYIMWSTWCQPLTCMAVYTHKGSHTQEKACTHMHVI